MPWIKTQDKTTLVFCDDFNVVPRRKRKKVLGYLVLCGKTESTGSYKAALYSSLEKALKVIEQLELYIFSRERENARMPFQFPLDEEVKV